MAENKGSAALARSIQKTIGRTKAKVLQSLGKADKTTDEIFKSYVGNFERQQHVATVLQKELKHYLQCVKAMTVAAKSLYETILQEVYEPEWTEQIVLGNAVKSLDMLYVNYEAELNDRVYGDLLGYLSKFPDYKEKISKRSRKLLDYDNARHEYETVLNAKKKDDSKIGKSREILSEAKHTYEDLNAELHRELPEFYDHRVAFSAANLQALFRAESTFHLESGKITDQLNDLAGRLATEFSEGQHKLKILPAALLTRDATIDHQEGGSASGEASNEYATIQDEHPVDLSTLSVQSRPDVPHSDSEGDASVRVADVALASPNYYAPGPVSPGGSVKMPQRPPSQPKTRAPSVKVAAGATTPAEGSSEISYASLTTSGNASVTTAASESSEPLYAKLLTGRAPTVPPPQPPTASHPELEAAAPALHAAADGRSSAGVALSLQQQEPDVVARHANSVERSDAGSLRVSASSTADGGSAPAASAGISRSSSSDSGLRMSKSGADSGDDQPVPVSANGVQPQTHPLPAAASAIVTAKPVDDTAAPAVSLPTTAAQPSEPRPVKGTVRQVVATHAYNAEDEDELTFEPGEIITLVSFDDPEDQDEGWEMGVKLSDGRKGVFPANFTRPV